MTVALCVENVLVGGRNFNKFKSARVTDKCCQAGTGGGRAVPPSGDLHPATTTETSLVHSHWSRNVEAPLSLVESFPSDARASSLMPWMPELVLYGIRLLAKQFLGTVLGIEVDQSDLLPIYVILAE